MSGPQKRCHYCGRPADTRDHIVPRSRVPWEFRSGKNNPKITNTVPSCYECNQRKQDKRSDCTCPTCELAWYVYGPLDADLIPIVEMSKSA